MTQSASNLRTKRTRTLLRTALIDLLKERGFDALTVGEIAERAMVSRAGFYRYYQDKYDLVEQLFDESVHTMMRNIDASPRIHKSGDETEALPEAWVQFFEHFVEYAQIYRVVFASKSRSWFLTKMHTSLEKAMHIRVQQPSSCVQNGRQVADSYDRLAPSLAATLLIEMITRWFEDDLREPPREIALRSSKMASSLLKEVGTWNNH
ncbi:TetR/AcrR family transcriptional regulator [Ktedonospora formicarum]|uniref:TetR family transcriptional regulator n=1 Tax=Ktedonospora formicarum TaxID=2778364 RepID=A0A8J3HX09_9CHLR|nr:TetR/AcrR family transcriptional regulator [Ktedonospora formicarum]GHO42428.1 TetR family transcriptional regulator [Ktedonospora formicarum]